MATYRYYAVAEKEEHTPNMQIIRETYETYQLGELIEESHPGDTIVFTSILSLGSDPDKVCDIYSRLLAAEICFTFQKHPHCYLPS